MSTESSSNMFSAVCKQEQSRLAVTPKKIQKRPECKEESYDQKY